MPTPTPGGPVAAAVAAAPSGRGSSGSGSSLTSPVAGPPIGSNRPTVASCLPQFESLPLDAFARPGGVLTTLGAADQLNGPPTVDAGRQLLIDDTVIDSLKNAARVLNQPLRYPGNPVIRPDTPWEAGGAAAPPIEVLYDPAMGKLRMWYHAATKLGPAAAHAVSADGLRWEKPALDFAKWEGRPTNIVMADPFIEAYGKLSGVMIDPSDGGAGRYKAVYLYRNPNTGVRGLKTATSPDGLKWTVGAPLLQQVNDISRAFRDPRSGKFVIVGRLMRQGRRCVQRLESEDFVFWTNGEPLLEPDPDDRPGDDFHCLTAFAYGKSYLGLLSVCHNDPAAQNMDVQLAASRDGWKWSRLCDRGTFLPFSARGDWDRHQVTVAAPPMQVADQLWFYYGGRSRRLGNYSGPDNGPDWGGVGLASIRVDGFAHIEGSFDGGVVTTKPLLLRGAKLHVNVASAFGQAQVQLLDAEGRPIEGMASAPVVADSTDWTVQWLSGRDLSGWTSGNRPMRLRFILRNARLYSFWTSP
jgi:hypothetical protein